MRDYREATHPSVDGGMVVRRPVPLLGLGGRGTTYPSGGGEAEDNIHSYDIRIAKRR